MSAQRNVNSSHREPDLSLKPGPGAPPRRVPGGLVEKPADFSGTLRKLLAYLRPERRALAGAAALAVFAVAASVAGPYVLALATNHLVDAIAARATGGTAVIDYEYVRTVLVALVALYLGAAGFGWLQNRMTVNLSQSVVLRMRSDVSDKLDRLPLGYFDKHPVGQTLARTTVDIDLVSSNLQQIVSQVLTAVVTLVGIAVMMLVISPVLAGVALLIIPLTVGATALIAPRSQKYFAQQQKSLGTVNGIIEENFAGHVVVRAFGREQQSIDTFSAENDQVYDSAWRAQFISGLVMPAAMFIGNLGYVIVVVVAAILSASGGIRVGHILAFIQYLQQFNQPLMTVAQISAIIQGTVAAAERVFTLLGEEEESDPYSSTDQRTLAPERPCAADALGKPCSGHVVVRNVDFSYDAAVPMIQDLSFEAMPGQMVAIVGPTGAGKTTLVNLLMRFYDIQAGTIEIDGVDISTLSRDAVRAQFGMVLQDTWLYAATIRENIAYGSDGATDEDVVRAAQIALADRFIRTLPDGYDTVLTEDAGNLSAGQRQLITIARAVLADAPIMILDEATSSVDTRTERLIQEAMRRLMQGRTSFVIAHRLSTIRDADLIIVMEDGRVVESGSHDDLIAKCGFYAELYQAQFRDGEIMCDIA